MRIRALLTTVPLVLAASDSPAADASVSGPEVGLRAGYSLPSGRVGGTSLLGPVTDSGTQLQDLFSAGVPFTLDAGYRIGFPLYVGLFGQYGPLFVADSPFNAQCSPQYGIQCSGYGFGLGVDVQYHFVPASSVDPWLGLGVGYEWVTLNAALNRRTANLQYSGPQFLDFQIGCDYRGVPYFGIGPFVMVSAGQYSSFSASPGGGSATSGDVTDAKLHAWWTFGLRLVYDINGKPLGS